MESTTEAHPTRIIHLEPYNECNAWLIGHIFSAGIKNTPREHIPLTRPRLFSVDSPCIPSGSLKLAESGNRSCWKSKPEIEYDRPRWNEPARIGPSESSSARRESSESLEWRDTCEGGDLSDALAYDSDEDVIE